jgi:hypothetical protein
MIGYDRSCFKVDMATYDAVSDIVEMCSTAIGKNDIST